MHVLDSQLEIQSKKSSHGGKREGAGRKAGKLSAAKLELRDLAKEHAPDMIAQLVDIAKNSSSDSAKVAAIKEVLDRAYGKAPQAIEGDLNVNFTHEDAIAALE